MSCLFHPQHRPGVRLSSVAGRRVSGQRGKVSRPPLVCATGRQRRSCAHGSHGSPAQRVAAPPRNSGECPAAVRRSGSRGKFTPADARPEEEEDGLRWDMNRMHRAERCCTRDTRCDSMCVKFKASLEEPQVPGGGRVVVSGQRRGRLGAALAASRGR